MSRIIIALIVSFVLSIPFAFAKAEDAKPLSPQQAFEFSSSINKNNQLILEWHMAPNYYLYRDKIHVTLLPGSEAKINENIAFPKGKTKHDELNGTYQIYTDTVQIPVDIIQPVKGILNLTVSYQGCSTNGFCYPPIKKDVRIDVSTADKVNNVVVTSQMQPTSHDAIESIFDGKSNLVIILTFLGLGLLMAFTPCVLPMIPILSGIIVGRKDLTTSKAFILSLVYVLGMALTYAIAGMVVALIGSRIQTVFQTPWVIIAFSGLFVLLSLSLFGYYELELPRSWQRKVTNLSNKQQGGTYVGVFLMGVLSSLIVSPCVSAPLVGVLAYIANTGDMILGFMALLALGFGMGVPLLLIGTSAGKWLPKSGPWMEAVKKIFGVLLLGMAVMMLSRVISGPAILVLWAVLLICTAMFMGVFNDAKQGMHKVVRGLGFVMFVYGILLVAGAVLGGSDPLRPLTGSQVIASESPNFQVVKDMNQLDAKLAEAKLANKPVILDFYADWCVSCVAMDRHVFTKPQIHTILKNYVLLRADVTKNNDFDQALLKRFNVIAPPTIIFFNHEGQEAKDDRIVGELDTKEMASHLNQFDLAQNANIHTPES